MLFEGVGELRSFGFLDRDEVLDAQRVEHLAAEALRGDARADALARGIHGGCGTGGATADDQHVERILGGDLGGFALDAAGVDLGEDFFQAHAALAELGAVQEHGRHGHDLAFLDFVLEGAALDHRGADARVLDGHQVQRLDHVGAVVAGERDVDLELEITVERLDLVEHGLLDLRGVAADLQQRKDQRREFMAHRQAGKARAVVFARAVDRERGLAVVVVAAFGQRDQRRDFGNVLQQRQHFARSLAVVERGNDLDRLRGAFEVTLQLGFGAGVKHGGLSFDNWKLSTGDKKARGLVSARALRGALRSCRRGRTTERWSCRRHSTWPGRLRSGARRCRPRP
ncbi:hypothetical protein D3C87_975340 [compost metagenome]